MQSASNSWLPRCEAVALCVTAVGIVGCAVPQKRYYLPADGRYAEEETVCGFVPWGYVRLLHRPNDK